MSVKLVFTPTAAFDVSRPARNVKLTPQDRSKMARILKMAGLSSSTYCHISLKGEEEAIVRTSHEQRVVKLKSKDMIDPKNYEIAVALLDEKSLVDVISKENDIWHTLCSYFGIERSLMFELLDDLGFDLATTSLLAEKLMPRHLDIIKPFFDGSKNAQAAYKGIKKGNDAVAVLQKELKRERTLSEKLEFVSALLTLSVIVNKLSITFGKSLVTTKLLKMMELYYSTMMLMTTIGSYVTQIYWVGKLVNDGKNLISIRPINQLGKLIKSLKEEQFSASNLEKAREKCVYIAKEYGAYLPESIEIKASELEKGVLDKQQVLDFAMELREEIIRYDVKELENIATNKSCTSNIEKVFGERISHDLTARIKAINLMDQSSDINLKKRAITEGAKMLNEAKQRIVKRVFFQTIGFLLAVTFGVVGLSVSGPLGWACLGLMALALLGMSGYGLYQYYRTPKEDDWLDILRHNVLQNEFEKAGLKLPQEPQVEFANDFITMLLEHAQNKQRMQEVFRSCLHQLQLEEERISTDEMMSRIGSGIRYQEIHRRKENLKIRLAILKSLFVHKNEEVAKFTDEQIATGFVKNQILVTLESMQFAANK